MLLCVAISNPAADAQNIKLASRHVTQGIYLADWVTHNPSLFSVAAGINPSPGSILAATQATRHMQYRRSLFDLNAVHVCNFSHSLTPVTARGALCDKLETN